MSGSNIEVTADIYCNYFDKNQPYYYDNIKVVNESEEEVLDRALNTMYNSNSTLLVTNQPFCPNNRIEPIEENVKLILNTQKMNFKKV